MARMINSAGLALIKEYEGLRLEAYPDQADPPIWTIGYGHTHGVKEGDTCNQFQADEWLEQDLIEAESKVLRLVKVPLTDNQFSALVSFAFNEKDFPVSTLLKKLNAGDYEAVLTELPKWKYAGHKVQPGLVKRRAAEAALWTA
jgi:Phage-related lysozyme (muraminidase)